MVDIPYDPPPFSIRYARGSNLDYDGANIAPDCNTYVQRLHRATVTQPAI